MGQRFAVTGENVKGTVLFFDRWWFGGRRWTKHDDVVSGRAIARIPH